MRQPDITLAAKKGSITIVRKAISEGININVSDSEGRMTIMLAVLLLLESGANPNIVDKVEGLTGLMFAVVEGRNKVVRALMAQNTDQTVLDVDGEITCDFAANNNHLEVV